MPSPPEKQSGVSLEPSDELRRFVEASLGTTDFELALHHTQGFTTQAYSCETDADSFILRHGTDWWGMQKDDYAGRHFDNPEKGLPVPRVIAVRRLTDKTALCLSRRVHGDAPNEVQLSTPGSELNLAFAATLRAIHTTDISTTRGYSYVKGDGRGISPRVAYAAGAERTYVSLQWGRLAKRFSELDPGTFREATVLRRQLGRLCIVERRLCHGDLKDANLLADEARITGVIDWARFQYGDPALDLGILHQRYPRAINPVEHCETIGSSMRNIWERVLYYAMSECLVAIGFFGKEGNEVERSKAESRLTELLHEVSTQDVTRP